MTVTITTGGTPGGKPSELPSIRDKRYSTAATAHKRSTIAWTLLLRRSGKREDRAIYGRGFEDFLDGSAKCMIIS